MSNTSINNRLNLISCLFILSLTACDNIQKLASTESSIPGAPINFVIKGPTPSKALAADELSAQNGTTFVVQQGASQSLSVVATATPSPAYTPSPSSGQKINWTVASRNGAKPGVTSSTTDKSGVASFSWTSAPVASDNSNIQQVVTASLDSNPSLKVIFNISVLPPSTIQKATSASGDMQTSAVGTAAKNPLVVSALDSKGSSITLLPTDVTWSVSSGGGSIKPATGTKPASTVSATITPGSSGDFKQIGYINVTQACLTRDPKQCVVFSTYGAPGSFTTATVTMTSGSGTLSSANILTAYSLTAQATDAKGAIIPGSTVVWSLDPKCKSNCGSLSSLSNNPITYTTSYVPGKYNLTASVSVTDSKNKVVTKSVTATINTSSDTGPYLTGLTSPIGPVANQNWTWGCYANGTQNQCSYSFIIDHSPITQANSLARSGNQSSASQSETQLPTTQYLHIIAQYNGKSSTMTTVSAVIDPVYAITSGAVTLAEFPTGSLIRRTTTDSSGNIFVAGQVPDSQASPLNGGLPLPLIAKYDNKMKLLWQQNVLTSNYPSSNPPIIFYGLAAATDGSVYVVGQMQGSTGYCYSGCTSYAFQAPATGTPITWTPNTTGPTPFIVKYGSDGTPQWVNSIYDNTSGMNASGIASGSFYNVSVDSGNSPVAVGEMSAPPNSYCDSNYNSSYTTPFFSNTQITSSSYYYNNPGTIASISSCSAKNILAAGFDVNGNNKWSTSASYTSNNCSYCSSPTTDPTVYSYFSDVKISGSTLYAVGNMREPTSSNMNNMGGGPPAGMLLFGNNTAQVPVSITPNLTGLYSLSTNWNAFLVSYDLSTGQPSPQWVTQPYRTSSDNRFVSIGIDGQSNIYATGQIGSQAMKVKYDLSGNVLSTKLGVSSGTSSVSFYYGIGLDAITNKEYGYGLYNYTPTDDGTQPGGVFDFLGTTPSGSSNFFRQFLW